MQVHVLSVKINWCVVPEERKMVSADERMFGLTRSNDHVALLALRLVCICAVVALMMMHLRSVRVFRWEQSVSGGFAVTYIIAVVGLALCSGMNECGAKVLQVSNFYLLLHIITRQLKPGF